VSNDRTCYNCREPGHFAASCPYKQNQYKAPVQGNSSGSARTAASGAGHGGQQASAQQKRPTQSFGRRRVNRIHAQEAREASDVVLGEFLVESTLAIVLFDSGASHSFIASKFVAKHKIPTVLLKTPLITHSLGASIKYFLGCPWVRIMIKRIEFLANLVVLQSEGINVIL
jgi:hypothetical protein